PCLQLLQRRRLEMAGTVLRLPPPRDEAGAFEDFEVLGHRREAHVVGLGQFADGRIAGAEPCEDAPPCRIRECGQGLREPVWHLYSTVRLSTYRLNKAHGFAGQVSSRGISGTVFARLQRHELAAEEAQRVHAMV